MIIATLVVRDGPVAFDRAQVGVVNGLEPIERAHDKDK
jgi:hypothetical protein